MHFTLRPKVNLRLIALWAVVFCIALALQADLIVVAAFAGVGLLAGVLQNHAIRQVPERLQAAGSAGEVRKVLFSVPTGKLAVALLWGAGLGLLLLGASGLSPITGMTLIGAYAAFCMVRDLAALNAVLSLSNLK